MRFDQLVEAFTGSSIGWDAKRIRYHANLTDRPDAVTWKEFRALIANPPATGELLDAWIAAHSSLVKATPTAVAAELMDSLVRYHSTTMDESAASATAEAHAERVRRVGRAIAMLSVLWLSSSHAPSLRTAKNFRAVVSTFRSWARFDLNQNDRDQRVAEAALLDEIVAVVDEPTECLALLEPWNHEDYDEDAASLTKRITDSLIARAAQGAMERFAEAGAIKTMFRSKQYAAEYVLTQVAPTWLPDGRTRLREYAVTSPHVVAENLRLFVESLLQPTHFVGDAKVLLADRAIIELWWELITAVRWQARFFRGLEELKAQLENNNPLPTPAWWEDARTAAYRDSPPSASPEPDTTDDDGDDGDDGVESI